MFTYNKKRVFYRLIFLNILLSSVFVALGHFEIIIYKYLLFSYIFLLLFFNIIYFNKFFFSPLYLVCKEIAAILAGNSYQSLSIKTKDEFGLIAMFFNQVTKNIENVSQIIKEGSRMANELALASQIQKSVLPKEIPLVDGLDIVAKTRPAEEVGGDSFDIELNNGEYYFYLGDVTGHGAPAGLVMIMVNTLFDVFLSTVTNTKDLTVIINNQLKPRVNSSFFMTASFFRWLPVDKKLYYTGAGHENIIIFRANEGISQVFPAGGIALAMADDITTIVEEKEIELGDQDIIVLYSDGITEAVNPNGELLGLERLRISVNKHGHLGSSLEVFEKISLDVQSFVGDAIQKDDMTLFVIRKNNIGSQDRSENLVSTKWFKNE
jgi:sigma-B regulation protein RsbU (phosphoserine phosphatase)